MSDSILVSFSEKKETIASFQGEISLVSYFRQYDCWFFSRPGVNSLFKLESSGIIEEWQTGKELTDLCGLCCGFNSVFTLNKNGDIYGYNIEDKNKYRVIGLRAKNEIRHKARSGFEDGINFLTYDNNRDYLYIHFPKRGDIYSIGGTEFTHEFGSMGKEFSVGSVAKSCGIISPVSISVSKKWEVAIADKTSNAIWLFETEPKQQKLIGVYGSPQNPGGKDGPLLKSTFSSPSCVLYLHEKIYVLDNQNKRVREIDVKEKTCKTLCETNAKILCLTTDHRYNPCWVEIGQ